MPGWIATKYPSPWRLQLVASRFRNVEFHVEQSAKLGGRRVALHEYPKRDLPYAEDMGRRTKHIQITGYLVGPNYQIARDNLSEALDREGASTLVYGNSGVYLVVCEEYTVTEVRERGGYCVVEMRFVEEGTAGNAIGSVSTAAVVGQAASRLEAATASALDQSLGSASRGVAAAAGTTPGTFSLV